MAESHYFLFVFSNPTEEEEGGGSREEDQGEGAVHPSQQGPHDVPAGGAEGEASHPVPFVFIPSHLVLYYSTLSRSLLS